MLVSAHSLPTEKEICTRLTEEEGCHHGAVRCGADEGGFVNCMGHLPAELWGVSGGLSVEL